MNRLVSPQEKIVRPVSASVFSAVSSLRRFHTASAHLGRPSDTPAKRIYLAVQLMYISGDPMKHHQVYFSLMQDILQAAPSTGKYIANINNQILTGDLYKALKSAKKLIEYEQELLQHATGGAGLRSGGKADRQSA